jgi:nitrogen fixation NifU-like protein
MTEKEAKTLYQDAMVEHGKAPHNQGALPGATHEATTKNPLCGDRVTLRLRVEDDRIREARFEARGCMIARASASLLTEAVLGRSVAEAQTLVRVVEGLVTGEPFTEADAGPLEPLRGAKEFPARRTCVTLAWHALEASLAVSAQA